MEYSKLLKTELGAAKTVEDYQLPLPDGEEDKEYSVLVKQVFLEEGIPVNSAINIANKVNAFNKQRMEAAKQELENLFATQSKTYKDSHKGDTLVTGTRTAIKAIVQFGTPELVKAIKDSKILSNPSDLGKLRGLEIWPSQLAIWENIGTMMKSDAAITNEGEPSKPSTNEPTPGTTEAVVHKAYDHPSSVADRKSRGKQY